MIIAEGGLASCNEAFRLWQSADYCCYRFREEGNKFSSRSCLNYGLYGISSAKMVTIPMRQIQPLQPQFRLLFADLKRQVLDATAAGEPHDLRGRLILARRKSRQYWYRDLPDEKGGKNRIYIGPADRPDIESQVTEWKMRKAANRERRKIVSVLIREAYLPSPDKTAGAIIEALTAGGVASPAVILLGQHAYGVYSAIFGVRLPRPAKPAAATKASMLQTISFAVREDVDPEALSVLQRIDSTFREYTLPARSRMAGRYVSKTGYAVEFPIASRGIDYHGGRFSCLPPLVQAGQDPPRAVDFLARQAARGVLLHGAGLFVPIPTPERYAVHALLKAGRLIMTDERALPEINENIIQARAIMEALIQQGRTDELARICMEACDCGPYWKVPIRLSLINLREADTRLRIQRSLADAISKRGRDPASYGIDPAG